MMAIVLYARQMSAAFLWNSKNNLIKNLQKPDKHRGDCQQQESIRAGLEERQMP